MAGLKLLWQFLLPGKSILPVIFDLSTKDYLCMCIKISDVKIDLFDITNILLLLF